MKKILIPTDFSQNATNAFEYTLDLCKGQKLNIHIISVINPDIVTVDVPLSTIDLTDIEYKEAIQKLKELKTQHANDLITITTEVKISTITRGIIRAAKEQEADLIVMGTRGTNHNKYDKILGTISSDILIDTPCPVILVPIDYKFKTIDNLVFASQMNHQDPYELWRATELLKPQVAQLRILYVMKDNDTTKSKELNQFAQYMVEHSPSIQSIFNIVESNDVEHAIEEYAETYDAELIVMHRSKKSFLKNILSKRHTKAMTSIINRPLMIIN